MSKKRASTSKQQSDSRRVVDGHIKTGIYRRKLTTAERKAHGLAPEATPPVEEANRRMEAFSERAIRICNAEAAFAEIVDWLIEGLRSAGYVDEPATSIEDACTSTVGGGPVFVGIGDDAIAYPTRRPIERGTQASDAAEALDLLRDIEKAVSDGDAATAALRGVGVGRLIERLKVRPFESLVVVGKSVKEGRKKGGAATAILSPEEWESVAVHMKNATSGGRAATFTEASKDVAKQLATGRMRGVRGRRVVSPETIRKEWRNHLPDGD